jgi:hypothetical protein
MKKLILDTIKRKTMTSGAPFTNMRKDHPSQKEKVQLQSNYKPLNLLRKEAIEVKRKKKIKRQISQAKINSRMETPSMVISFIVITLAIKQWTARN